MKKSIKWLTLVALGIALYFVLSLSIKIPLINHISLDLGYIVLAVYCYAMGWLPGMIIGGTGCVLISLLTSGWFPPGWFLANLLIGSGCGLFYKQDRPIYNSFISVIFVFLGVMLIKSLVESYMFGIPLEAKLITNAIAASTDSLGMVIGVLIAPRIVDIPAIKNAV